MKLLKVIASAALVLSLAVSANAGKKLVVDGSSTILPIAQALAEKFMDKHADITISVKGGGSGIGIASLQDSTCDIADKLRRAVPLRLFSWRKFTSRCGFRARPSSRSDQSDGCQ